MVQPITAAPVGRSSAWGLSAAEVVLPAPRTMPRGFPPGNGTSCRSPPIPKATVLARRMFAKARAARQGGFFRSGCLVASRRISKFEKGRRAEILRVYGQFITKPKVWLISAQANGLGSLCGIGISAECALHRHAEDDSVEDYLTERFWHAATILGRPSSCNRWVPT